MEQKTSYFGLTVHAIDGTPCVRLTDVQRLPFYDFWSASAVGSTQLVKGDECFVLLTDWEVFAHLFIQTGRHRFSESTVKTLESSERGEDVHHAKDAKDLFEQLGI